MVIIAELLFDTSGLGFLFYCYFEDIINEFYWWCYGDKTLNYTTVEPIGKLDVGLGVLEFAKAFNYWFCILGKLSYCSSILLLNTDCMPIQGLLLESRD